MKNGGGKRCLLTILICFSFLMVIAFFIMLIIRGENALQQPWETIFWASMIVCVAAYVSTMIVQRTMKTDLPDRRAAWPDKNIDCYNGTLVKPVFLGKSAAEIRPSVQNDGREILFHTIGARMKLLPPKELPTEYQVASAGYISSLCPQKALYEIVITFSLHNHTNETIRLYDMHTRLYHSKTYKKPYLSIGYIQRYRVDLLSDNSILENGIIFEIPPGAAAYIDLATEVSFYGESEATVLVFGLEADVEAALKGQGFSGYRIPSEKIYAIHYMGKNNDNTWIKEFDGAEIQTAIIKKKKPLYTEIMKIWEKHTGNPSFGSNNKRI